MHIRSGTARMLLYRTVKQVGSCGLYLLTDQLDPHPRGREEF
jgi:hypothetical protein